MKYKNSCFFRYLLRNLLMLNLILAKITKANPKLIIIVIIIYLLYVLICNGTKYEHKINLYNKHNILFTNGKVRFHYTN